jgi:hypothetical protein
VEQRVGKRTSSEPEVTAQHWVRAEAKEEGRNSENSISTGLSTMQKCSLNRLGNWNLHSIPTLGKFFLSQKPS